MFFKFNTKTNECLPASVCVIQLGRRNKLMKSIEESAWLLKVTPVDKIHYSCDPKLDGSSLKLQYDRSNLAKAIRENSLTLKVVDKSDINDRSSPVIELVHIRFSERRAFLHKLLTGVELFYIRVLHTVSHIHHSSVDTAKYFADNAPIKAREFVDQSKEFSHDFADGVKETAAETSALASELFNDAVSKGKETATAAKYNAQGLIVSGKGKVVAAKSRAQEIKLSIKATAQEIEQTGDEVAASIRETTNEFVESVRETALLASAKTTAIAQLVREQSRDALERGRLIVGSSSREDVRRRTLPRSRSEEAAVYAAYSALLHDVEHNRQDMLNHVLLSEIRDSSKPFIPSSYALEQTHKNTAFPFHARRQVLSEIKRTATLRTLNHVSMRDASAPIIEGVKVDLTRGNSKQALLEEVKNGVELSKPSSEEIKDRSAPIISAGISAM